jgi:transcriptional regulator with XRE-family HTH domain
VDRLSVTIARNARAVRAAEQLRQVEVAERAGISRTRLSLIESGERRLLVEDVYYLCRGLGVTLERLLEGANPADRQVLGL